MRKAYTLVLIALLIITVSLTGCANNNGKSIKKMLASEPSTDIDMTKKGQWQKIEFRAHGSDWIQFYYLTPSSNPDYLIQFTITGMSNQAYSNSYRISTGISVYSINRKHYDDYSKANISMGSVVYDLKDSGYILRWENGDANNQWLRDLLESNKTLTVTIQDHKMYDYNSYSTLNVYAKLKLPGVKEIIKFLEERNK